ncbi:hypothetical protein E2C01_042808 [Portunus trituberculatus]|uniref:Uncharacterized protein n=1 Tax=Portunus trituberculatus TaxID=210409 RepID=A0A5B7FMR6_PORTR|nr:hypothetical protein [Portunus trituberculatus]
MRMWWRSGEFLKVCQREAQKLSRRWRDWSHAPAWHKGRFHNAALPPRHPAGCTTRGDEPPKFRASSGPRYRSVAAAQHFIVQLTRTSRRAPKYIPHDEVPPNHFSSVASPVTARKLRPCWPHVRVIWCGGHSGSLASLFKAKQPRTAATLFQAFTINCFDYSTTPDENRINVAPMSTHQEATRPSSCLSRRNKRGRPGKKKSKLE